MTSTDPQQLRAEIEQLRRPLPLAAIGAAVAAVSLVIVARRRKA